MLTVTGTGLEESLARLTDLERNQLPFATALALTRVAEDVKARLQGEMRSVFDRPTPYTLDSLRLIPATKERLSARVWIKDEADKASPATRWLTPEVFGGNRREKRVETLLQNRGLIGSGRYITPAKGAKLDRYGNLNRGQLQQILSGLGAQFDRYSNSTDSRRSRGNRVRFFVMRKAGRAFAIGERLGKRSIAVRLAIVARPNYSTRLDFFAIGEAEARARLPSRFEAALAQALRSARSR